MRPARRQPVPRKKLFPNAELTSPGVFAYGARLFVEAGRHRASLGNEDSDGSVCGDRNRRQAIPGSEG